MLLSRSSAKVFSFRILGGCQEKKVASRSSTYCWSRTVVSRGMLRRNVRVEANDGPPLKTMMNHKPKAPMMQISSSAGKMEQSRLHTDKWKKVLDSNLYFDIVSHDIMNAYRASQSDMFGPLKRTYWRTN